MYQVPEGYEYVPMRVVYHLHGEFHMESIITKVHRFPYDSYKLHVVLESWEEEHNLQFLTPKPGHISELMDTTSGTNLFPLAEWVSTSDHTPDPRPNFPLLHSFLLNVLGYLI